MIAIVDYGLGNIAAFANIYHRLDIPYLIADTPKKLSRATHVILPGVGAFDYALSLLENSGMRPLLDQLANANEIPILGVCVGMQIMARSSEEGVSQGLGWVPAEVKLINNRAARDLPLPHMGWNKLEPVKETLLLEELDSSAEFYFLHSYYFECDNPEDVLARANYAHGFDALFQHGNIYGMQCHPEKSHKNGENFLALFARL